MNDLTHGSLFSGIGGFELGAQMAGIDTIWNCEIVPYNRQILKQHYPNTYQYEDIRELRNPAPVSIISGGFPCQDLSIAGKRKGITGERSGLWSEMYRIIDETRPSYVVIENSTELLKKGFEKVLYPLSEIGYNAEWQCLQGSDFGLPHLRERVYVIAYSNEQGKFSHGVGGIFKNVARNQNQGFRCEVRGEYELDTEALVLKAKSRQTEQTRYDCLPLLVGADDEFSSRLYALGNAVMPRVAHYLFECIKAHYQHSKTVAA